MPSVTVARAVLADDAPAVGAAILALSDHFLLTRFALMKTSLQQSQIEKREVVWPKVTGRIGFCSSDGRCGSQERHQTQQRCCLVSVTLHAEIPQTLWRSQSGSWAMAGWPICSPSADISPLFRSPPSFTAFNLPHLTRLAGGALARHPPDRDQKWTANLTPYVRGARRNALSTFG